jgi:hypothetical protein
MGFLKNLFSGSARTETEDKRKVAGLHYVPSFNDFCSSSNDDVVREENAPQAGMLGNTTSSSGKDDGEPVKFKNVKTGTYGGSRLDGSPDLLHGEARLNPQRKSSIDTVKSATSPSVWEIIEGANKGQKK